MSDPKKPGARPLPILDQLTEDMTEKHPELAPLLRKLNSPSGRLGILVAIIAVLTSFFYTSYLKGVDSGMRHDLERVSDLQQISLAIQDYYNETNNLPDTLKGLEDRPNPNYMRDGYMYDSESHRLYEYRVLDPTSYQLCATFHYTTEKIAHGMPSDVFNPIWDHDTGHQCFKTKVKPPPRKIQLLEP